MAETSIEWTDSTWNPVAGCAVLTAGCTNCYAMRMAARLEAMDVAKYRGLTRKSGTRHVWTGRVRLDEAALSIPLSWKKPRKIFVNSMSDLFHDDVPSDFVARVWSVMAQTPRHTYQILTKRPDRMRAIVIQEALPVLPNVWLGASVEDARVLYRLDELRGTPAAVRFVSFEPLIGSVANANLKKNSLGHSWRRVRASSQADGRKVGRGNSCALCWRRNGILFSSNGVDATRRLPGASIAAAPGIPCLT